MISEAPGNERPLGAPRLTNWLLLSDTIPNQTITLTFPIEERTERYRDGWEGHSGSEQTIIHTRPIGQRTVYTLRFRGNTLVDIQPRQGGGVPVYDRREHLLKEKAPMKTVIRYVPPKRIGT